MIDIDALEALAKAATSGLPSDRIPFALHAMDPAAILALIAEVRALREDAERWRQLETYGKTNGEVVRHERRVRKPTFSRMPFCPTENYTFHVDTWVLREAKFRWWAKESEQPTLQDAIDAARKEKV